MASLDTSAFAYSLKQRYPQHEVENAVYKENPFFALVPKDENFTGSTFEMPLRYANTPGRSAAFATAQANKGYHKGVRFALARVSDYSLASITTEVIRASKRNPDAFLPAAEAEMNSCLDSLNRSIGISLYRNGTGNVAINGSATTTPITLATVQDITNFEVGDKIVASAYTGAAGDALLDTGAALTITTIDRDLGTIGFTGTISGFHAGDFLYKQGDAANGGANVRISGLAAWLPATAPASTAFFGIDRTKDVTRLGGIRKDISALPLVEGFVAGGNRIGREGGTPSHVFVNWDHYTNLVHELGAKVQYVDMVSTNGMVGFRGVKISAGKSEIIVVADVNCPYQYSYMLQLDMWLFASLGKAPDYLDEDGLQMLRDSTADSYEVRVGYYGNLGCWCPGRNAVLTMPT